MYSLTDQSISVFMNIYMYNMILQEYLPISIQNTTHFLKYKQNFIDNWTITFVNFGSLILFIIVLHDFLMDYVHFKYDHDLFIFLTVVDCSVPPKHFIHIYPLNRRYLSKRKRRQLFTFAVTKLRVSISTQVWPNISFLPLKKNWSLEIVEQVRYLPCIQSNWV